MKAYCYASGLIEFGARTPPGAIQIASGREQDLRREIEVLARHGQGESAGCLLVPGVPEVPESAKANRERRGEVFALGFVSALRHLFPCAELPEGRGAALDAAIEHRHGELETTAGKEIKKGRASQSDRWAGYAAGSRAQLNQGLAEGQRKLEVIS